MSSANCLNACSRDCFSVLDTARTASVTHKEKFVYQLVKSNFKQTEVTPRHHVFVHL